MEANNIHSSTYKPNSLLKAFSIIIKLLNISKNYVASPLLALFSEGTLFPCVIIDRTLKSLQFPIVFGVDLAKEGHLGSIAIKGL